MYTFTSFHDVLAASRSKFFWVEREQGKYRFGHRESLYADGTDPEGASFDIGNNKVIICVAPNGEIRYMTFFDESEYNDNIPGVWVHKRSKIFQNLSFSIVYNGKEQRLCEIKTRITTFLLGSVIPVTEYTLPNLTVTILHFAPISRDANIRPRVAYSIIYIKNSSTTSQEFSINIPSVMHMAEAMQKDCLPPDICMEDGSRLESRNFQLPPGGEDWFSIYTTVYGEKKQPELLKRALYWFNETWQYYQTLTGNLSIMNDDFLAEFFIRTAHQCQQCIGMDKHGTIAGSSWGTNPTTQQIWMKDMYYSLLPMAWMDPVLFAKSMEWFSQWGVRPASRQFPGGVKHSLSNSLSSVLMAGQYYRATGDLAYFQNKPELVNALNKVIEEMFNSREDPSVWLFPSIWISDGLSLGNFHTGSNITVFAALKGLAAILDALGDKEQALSYSEVADRVREALLSRCVTEKGPYGPQFLEGIGEGDPALRETMRADSLEEFLDRHKGFGVQFYEFYNRNGSEPYLIHDGEETDTTLSPFYGLMEYDDPIYKNYTRFGLSEHNKFYCPVSKGILWEKCTDSTFPGYITGAANVVDKETYDGKPGYFAVIRKLVDFDGSIWWWPYPSGAKDNSDMKRVPGKCGWASGAFLTLMIHDWFGLSYDASNKILKFSPLDFLNYDWKNVPMGAAHFNISHNGNSYSVQNHNSFTIQLIVRFFGKTIRRDNKHFDAKNVQYLNRTAVEGCVKLLPEEQVIFTVEQEEI